MSRPYRPPRYANELPDDDAEAIAQLTGQDHGEDIDRRLKLMNAPRNCPPWMKNDPTWTSRFTAACELHEEEWTALMDAIEKNPKEIGDVSSDFIISQLYMLAKQDRKYTIKLQALKTLAEMKGLLKTEGSSADMGDALEAILERHGKIRGPRRVG